MKRLLISASPLLGMLFAVPGFAEDAAPAAAAVADAAAQAAAAAPVPNKGVTRTAEQIGGRPCEWHRPAASDGAVLLYLHGGAYLIGAPSTHRGICSSLARRAGQLPA